MPTDPVKRRQRLSSAERREQLSGATVAVLAARGFRGATAEEIARQAGVAKGLLWHHFDDLDDLFAFTARRALDVLSTAAAALIDLHAPSPEVIRAAVRAATSLRRTHSAERRAIREILYNLRDADGEPRLTQADLEGLYAAQEAIFRRGQDSGHFRTDLEARLLAVTYQGAVDSMLGYLDTHPHLNEEVFADTVAEILLGGIAR